MADFVDMLMKLYFHWSSEFLDKVTGGRPWHTVIMIISLERLLLLHNKILPSFLFILLGVSETYMKSFQLILSACSLQLLPLCLVYSFISKSCGYVIISFLLPFKRPYPAVNLTKCISLISYYWLCFSSVRQCCYSKCPASLYCCIECGITLLTVKLFCNSDMQSEHRHKSHAVDYIRDLRKYGLSEATFRLQRHVLIFVWSFSVMLLLVYLYGQWCSVKNPFCQQ
jgi:hypothetical protein